MDNSVLYSSKLIWIAIFFALYWAFCLFWAVKSARAAGTAAAFFIADRGLPPWVFIMGATASSFAGWIFIGQPALVLRDGLQAGYISFVAVVLPLAGALFLKRQWMLGRRFGYVTPGEMFADYFGDDAVRVFTAIVALLFAIPFLGLLLGAAADLVSIVTDGRLSRDAAMWSLAVVPLICVTLGGLRATAYAGTLQTLLIAVGVVILGLAAFHLVGGFEAMNKALGRIAQSGGGPWGATRGYGGGSFDGWFAVPGVAQWTEGLGKEMPVGGPWTGLMIMTFLLAFMGIQTAPAFSLWAFASRDPRAFAPQQVWASAAAAGLLLFVFAMLQGVGGLLLGAGGAAADAGQVVARVLPALDGGRQGMLTASFIALIGQTAPWLLGLLTVCAVVAITAGSGASVAAAGAIVARDLYMPFFDPAAGDGRQKRFSRVSMLIITALALLMATFARRGMVVLGELALSFSVQLIPALLAVTWVSWFTRRGVLAGLVVGAIVAVLTDSLGQILTGGALPWGQWPWTIHAAAWGLAANLAIAIIASAMTQAQAETARRERFHAFLREHAPLSARKSRLTALAWVATMAWIFFAVGPGIVIGNHIFGAPGAGYAKWDFGMPSIWAWQLMWWGLGTLLVWFLAYRMEMSTLPVKEVAPLADGVTAALDRARARAA